MDLVPRWHHVAARNKQKARKSNNAWKAAPFRGFGQEPGLKRYVICLKGCFLPLNRIICKHVLPQVLLFRGLPLA